MSEVSGQPEGYAPGEGVTDPVSPVDSAGVAPAPVDSVEERRAKLERMKEEAAIRAEERKLKAEERALEREEKKAERELKKAERDAKMADVKARHEAIVANARAKTGRAPVVVAKPAPAIPESYGASSMPPPNSASPPPYYPPQNQASAPPAAYGAVAAVAPVMMMQQQPGGPPMQMPVQQMPVQQMPVQQMPVQQMPVQQMPVQQMPVQQMPQAQMQQQQAVAPVAYVHPQGPVPDGMHEVYYCSYAQHPQYNLQVVAPVLPKIPHMDKRVYSDPNNPINVLKDLFDSDPNERSSEKTIDKSNWQRDEEAPTCQRCDAKFSFTVRKHHCRRCLLVVCSKCSSSREILIESKWERDAPKRVCDHCAFRRPVLGIQELPVSPYAPAADGATSSAPPAEGHKATSVSAATWGTRKGPSPRILYSQDIPPEFDGNAPINQVLYQAPVGTAWPLPVVGLPPGTASWIVGTEFPIARMVDQQTLFQAHQAQQAQLRAIVEFWNSDENVMEQHGIYKAVALANRAVEALPLKLQAALNARREVDLFREKVRALSNLPVNCDQASIHSIHAHYTKELIDFAQLTAGPAMMVIQNYLERVKHYQTVVKLDNAAREKADRDFRRARAIAAASAPRVDVVYY